MTSKNLESKSIWSVKDSYDSLFSFSISIIGLGFLVGIISKWVSFLSLDLAFWMFRIGVGIMALLVFLKLFVLIQGFINDNFRTPKRKAEEYNEKIAEEQKEIEKLLNFELEGASKWDLVEHRGVLEEAKFSKEALLPYLAKWYYHIDNVRFLVNQEVESDELEDFEEQKEQFLKEIKDLKKEKKQVSEGEIHNPEKEAFLKKYEGCIHVDASDLEEGEKRWLEEAGFLRTHQWCINKKDSVEFLIKPRHNESLSHAYLASAIFDYVKKLDANAKLSTTKTADIIFTSKNNSWAVEIETGKVHEKNKKQLLEKVNVLNEKFPERWFFAVTNKNLLSKYHKLGETIDRSGIIGRIDEIFSSK